MERKSKYIPVIRDKENGSYAFRGVSGVKETLRNVEALKKRGINPRYIDIVEVKEPRKEMVLRVLEITGIVLTLVDLGICLSDYLKKRKKKKDAAKEV